ncbi:MAG: tRNA preQ1(34) S-adenosylmethionine ribosyltransferase-isomerase QueA, partial [Gammaproteobacteria bacterium]
IAQQPLARRRDSRLLVLPAAGEAVDCQFAQLTDLLKPGDLLVMNNTRVIAARLKGKKQSGGRVEVLIERCLGSHEALAQIRASHSPKTDSMLELEGGFQVRVTGRESAFFTLEFSDPIGDVLRQVGQLPLPPYISRKPDQADLERYQTVYSQVEGAVAAPTAGLHFDREMLGQLRAMNIDFAEVTLHVGAGTFQPVRVDNLADHPMHAEWLSVSQQVVDKVHQTQRAGGRVIAVGTTSLRALESAAQSGRLESYEGDTRLFITPGYRFRVVDGLITNFHLPESTLLMLVSAFSGYERLMAAYRHAVAAKYRFFSYGDAMLLERKERP